MPRSLWIAFVAAGVCLVLAACHRSEPSGASLALTDSAARAPDADRAVANAPGARERKLVRNAGLRLEVEEYAAARERIDAALARVKGHVARARVEHADGAVAFASLELRVPAVALDGFVREVARASAHGVSSWAPAATPPPASASEASPRTVRIRAVPSPSPWRPGPAPRARPALDAHSLPTKALDGSRGSAIDGLEPSIRACQTALAGRYGYFRDELYDLAIGQRLSFGLTDSVRARRPLPDRWT